MKTIPAGDVQGQSLTIMEAVQARRESVVITKNGKPVAQLVPIVEKKYSIFGFLKGQGEIVGDIESSIPASEWKRFK